MSMSYRRIRVSEKASRTRKKNSPAMTFASDSISLSVLDSGGCGVVIRPSQAPGALARSSDVQSRSGEQRTRQESAQTHNQSHGYLKKYTRDENGNGNETGAFFFLINQRDVMEGERSRKKVTEGWWGGGLGIGRGREGSERRSRPSIGGGTRNIDQEGPVPERTRAGGRAEEAGS